MAVVTLSQKGCVNKQIMVHPRSRPSCDFAAGFFCGPYFWSKLDVKMKIWPTSGCFGENCLLKLVLVCPILTQWWNKKNWVYFPFKVLHNSSDLPFMTRLWFKRRYLRPLLLLAKYRLGRQIGSWGVWHWVIMGYGYFPHSSIFDLSLHFILCLSPGKGLNGKRKCLPKFTSDLLLSGG